MKPAWSLVFFTVLSGAGFGLAVVVGGVLGVTAALGMLAVGAGKAWDVWHVFVLLGVRGGDWSWAAVAGGEYWTAAAARGREGIAAGMGVSVALVAAGLGASVLHLANPRNAWRAVMRVRTSWLSREAVLATVFFPLMAAYAWVMLVEGGGGWTFWGLNLGLSVVVVMIARMTVQCTAMIYQSLKTVAAWNHKLTRRNFEGMAVLSGWMLWTVLLLSDIAGAVLWIFAARVWFEKRAYYRRLGAAQEVRVGRAIGYSQAAAKLLDAGHTGATFLTREFVFVCAAETLARRRRWAMGLMVGAPVALSVLSVVAWGTGEAGWAAAMRWASVPLVGAMFGGLLLERWLFFAEARHSVAAYH